MKNESAPLTYYDHPTQVAFYNADADSPNYIGGIALEDFIICGDCGCLFPIKEVLEDAQEQGFIGIIPYADWVDISHEILGEIELEDYRVSGKEI